MQISPLSSSSKEVKDGSASSYIGAQRRRYTKQCGRGTETGSLLDPVPASAVLLLSADDAEIQKLSVPGSLCMPECPLLTMSSYVENTSLQLYPRVCYLWQILAVV
jgi:hypothetical protein